MIIIIEENTKALSSSPPLKNIIKERIACTLNACHQYTMEN